ncbi:MAG TPA: phosphoribosyltransferase family protein [Acidimicrobiales bacterium]|nr:phosphoribosyltransferase family protein [Acidimicrobiales bacterium]MDP7352237.1 phosphoribosyltransferase family protein [Acidimicrobiales bacterium]HJL76253.1 phosphoribosyltransferase family protein [Acidimicrobiales bacterium]
MAHLGPEPLVWTPPGVDRIRVLGRYEGSAGVLVRGLKFANRRTPVRALGSALAGIGFWDDDPPDLVTWVPSTVERRNRRGFEHAALLARATGRELGVPVRRLLLRAPGPPQATRGLRQRLRGPAMRSRRFAHGASIVIVDDVVTTGTSLSMAANALRAAGASRISAVAVAATTGGTTQRPASRHRR